jgi:hypothetical protein
MHVLILSVKSEQCNKNEHPLHPPRPAGPPLRGRGIILWNNCVKKHRYSHRCLGGLGGEPIIGLPQTQRDGKRRRRSRC